MKKILSIILAAFLLTSLAGCGNHSQADSKETQTVTEGQKESAESTSPAEPETMQEETAQEETAQTETAQEETTQAETETAAEATSSEAAKEPVSNTPAAAAHSDILVAYFSATGTTKGVAEKIASVTGGDLYEILPAEPYTSDDLDYNDSSSRSTIEQNDKSVRPEIGSEDISLAGYTTIYLGFPIWWGEEPRILDTFAEKYSFEGITVIPFCTSASSGIGRSGSNMEALAGTGTWLGGMRFDGNVSESDLQEFIAKG